jgi:hypothetical protein
MSRSVRKTPIASNTTSGFKQGEKIEKVSANKRFRRQTKNVLRNLSQIDINEVEDVLDEDMIPNDMDEVSDIWTHKKDGKGWFGSGKIKDPNVFRKMISK